MNKSSLEVARQFQMRHSNLVIIIEKKIKKKQAIKRHFKTDHYIDSMKRQQIMYYIDGFGYGILLNWYLNKQAS